MDCEASKLNLLERMLFDETFEPTDLPISLLKTITEDFSDHMEIGRGGFAVVYKGFLGNGKIIAVKKLSNSINMDETKYNQEVGCLMRVRHKNIVRFLGYCADTHGKILDYEGKFIMADFRHRLLCFEYLPNGSLHDYISDASHGLEWSERYKILKGICEGLCHLHEAHVVHLDLKPANILLDDNMVPKISDFGLSRRFGENQTRTITSRLYGSLGYLAPEFHSGVITFKSDIYSLGVIFTEILTGQKGYCSVHNVLQNWRNRFDISSADKLLEQVRVCAQISIDCVNFDPEKRPVIQHIIQSLHETERTDQFMLSGMSTSLMPQSESQESDLPLFVKITSDEGLTDEPQSESRTKEESDLESANTTANKESEDTAAQLRRDMMTERMKLLQELVPGCNQVVGEVLVVDEVINYVQSLQRQIEHLSMNLSIGNR